MKRNSPKIEEWGMQFAKKSETVISALILYKNTKLQCHKMYNPGQMVYIASLVKYEIKITR